MRNQERMAIERKINEIVELLNKLSEMVNPSHGNKCPICSDCSQCCIEEKRHTKND